MRLIVISSILFLQACSQFGGKIDTRMGEYDSQFLIDQAAIGNGSAQHRLCYMYLYGRGINQNYEKAAHWCGKAAKKRYTRSMILYGEILLHGKGLPKNERSAFYWNHQAALSGNVHAQYVTAIMYITGKGVNRNVPKGIYWLSKSAKRGYPPAIRAIKKIEKPKPLII